MTTHNITASTLTASSNISVCDGDIINFNQTFESDTNLIKLTIIEHVKNQSKVVLTKTVTGNYINAYYKCRLLENDKTNLKILTITIQHIQASNWKTYTYNAYINITYNTTINSLGTIHLLQSQFIDSDNNHMFYVFESEKNPTPLLNILEQSANRLQLYNEQLSAIDVATFGYEDKTNYRYTLFKINNLEAFRTEYFQDIGSKTCMLIVPLSTSIVPTRRARESNTETDYTPYQLLSTMQTLTSINVSLQSEITG